MCHPVSLRDVYQALQFSDRDALIYLDKTTGAVVTGPEKSHGALAGQEPSVPFDAARYERIVVPSDRDELALAARFARTTENPENRQRLERALAATNAEDQFQAAIFRCKIAHEWFRFRDEQLLRFAEEWLKSRGILYVNDMTCDDMTGPDRAN